MIQISKHQRQDSLIRVFYSLWLNLGLFEELGGLLKSKGCSLLWFLYLVFARAGHIAKYFSDLLILTTFNFIYELISNMHGASLEACFHQWNPIFKTLNILIFRMLVADGNTDTRRLWVVTWGKVGFPRRIPLLCCCIIKK